MNGVAIAFLLIGAVENAVRKHEEDSADYVTLAASRFTIPVSIIVAAYNEAKVIESTVESFLGFDYPEFEVVVVNDGSTDETLERLCMSFELKPYEVFVRHVFPSQPVHHLPQHEPSESRRRRQGERGKADSWNAALNVARFRYVCGVDADNGSDLKALLKVMRFPMTDPARIIGVTSQIATAREPEHALAMPPGRRRIEGRLLALYQHLDFLRAFLNNRLAWSKFGFMMCLAGLPDLASRRARGGRRVLDGVHLRGHRARSASTKIQARGSRLRHPLPTRQRGRHGRAWRTSEARVGSASAGSGSSTRPSSTTVACGSTRSTAPSGWWERRSTS